MNKIKEERLPFRGPVDRMLISRKKKLRRCTARVDTCSVVRCDDFKQERKNGPFFLYEKKIALVGPRRTEKKINKLR